jgi:ABC-type transport system substrate-binding protein
MIKRIEKTNEKPAKEPQKYQVVKGMIESLNERGIKVNDRWYNFSKYLADKPELAENSEVEFIASGDFITKFLSVQMPTPETNADADNSETLLLESLRSAVKIASVLESEVSIKFSTNDIIKLALTLFIQKSSV